MTILKFFKKQFWKPTWKFFPRNYDQIFIGRSITNILFWLTLLMTIIWLIIDGKATQPVLDQTKVDANSLLFGDFYYSLSTKLQIFIIVSALSLLTTILKLVFFIIYYLYYKFNPISVEELIKNEKEDPQTERKEFAEAQQRLDYLNSQNKKQTKKQKNNRKKPDKKKQNTGSSLKKLN